MTYHATCCCGSLSVEIADSPKLNAVCHCNNCKKRTGSAFGHSLYFCKDTLGNVQGTHHVYSLDNEGGKQRRHFCPNCGTTLFWYWERFQEWVGVAGGCIVDHTPPPTISACHTKALNWVQVPEDWRRY